MHRSLSAWLLFAMLLGTLGYAIAEDLTLSTYYPSPRGVYNELHTTGTTLLASHQGSAVGIGTTTPNNKAILDITVVNPATEPKGLLPPRLTTAQRNLIAPPPSAEGLMVYNTDTNTYEYFDGTAWVQVASGGGFLPPGAAGQTLRFDGVGWSANNFLFNSGTAVGVGTSTTTPAAAFHVQGATKDASASAIHVTDSSGTALLAVRNDGVLDMKNHAVTNILSPIAPGDVANKAYVDAAAGGYAYEQKCAWSKSSCPTWLCVQSASCVPPGCAAGDVSLSTVCYPLITGGLGIHGVCERVCKNP